MSQPHNGQRAYLLSGNSFWFFLPKVSQHSPKVALLNSFEQKLAHSYEELIPKVLEDIFSLCWMKKVMSVIDDVHNNIKALMDQLQFPVSDWDEKLIDMYLDSSVKILDISIALCSEISRLDQGQLLLQYVQCILEKSSNSPSSDKLKRIRASLHDWLRKVSSRNPKSNSRTAIFQSLHGALDFPGVKNPTKGEVLMRALYGVRVLNIYIFSVLITALSSCSQTPIDMHVSGNFLWVEAFNKVKSVVDDEMRSHKSRGELSRLKEVKAVQVFVSRFHALTEAVECKEESMPRSSSTVYGMEASSPEKCNDSEESRSLKDCINSLSVEGEMLGHQLDALTKQVDEFFWVIISERDALLSDLRASLGSQRGERVI